MSVLVKNDQKCENHVFLGGNVREASKWPHIHESNLIWWLRIDWRWFQVDLMHRSGDNAFLPEEGSNSGEGYVIDKNFE